MTLMDHEPLVRHRRFTVDEYHRMAEAGVLTTRSRPWRSPTWRCASTTSSGDVVAPRRRPVLR